MIADEQQDRAALYVLGILDTDDLPAFESAMRDAELRALVDELQEAAGAIAFGAAEESAPAQAKDRVLGAIAAEARGQRTDALGEKIITPHPMAWLPWAIAALLFISLGGLLYNDVRLRREIADMSARDPLMQTKFVALAPAKGAGAPEDAKATVAWESDKQSGVIRISGLTPREGRDYQLWAVDAEHKDPINAGVIHVDEDGTAQVRFQPTNAAHKVKAFALSVERKGGVPKREGPILLIGNA